VSRGSHAIYGWAVPSATDVEFAVRMLALLGRSIPNRVRMSLLTLAIVDDDIVVLIIFADNVLVEEVRHDRQIQPTLVGPDVHDVRGEHLIARRRRNVARVQLSPTGSLPFE
jgi:hypothetical protein